MKKGVKIDNNRLKKLKLFAPYEGKANSQSVLIRKFENN